MKTRIRFVQACAIALSVAAPAAAGGLVDVLPDLIPGTVVSVSESAETQRPDFDNPGQTVIDTGWVYGSFTPQAELDSIAQGAFQEFQNLPVGSAVAAFTYYFDPATNVFRRSEQGLGPIFADRAQTIGKGKLNIGVSWSHIDFDEIEGTDLDSIPIDTTPTNVFVDTYSDTAVGSFDNQAHARTNTAPDVAYPPQGVRYEVVDNAGAFEAFIDAPTGDTIPIDSISDPLLLPQNGGFLVAAGPEGQYLTRVAGPSDLEADVNLEVELMNLYVSYGVLDNLDIGLLLPILHIDLDASVSFTTINAATIGDVTLAQLDASDYIPFRPGDFPIDQIDFDACQLEIDPAAVNRCIFDLGLSDIYNQGVHDSMDGIPSTSRADQRAYVSAVTMLQRMGDSESNTGIGDLTIRGKYKFLESRFVDMAARLDMAFPTGSEKNFRSTGEYMWGVNLIMSKAFGWFAPHANLAIQARTGGKENHQFRWMIGADAKLHERLAASVDFLGNEDLYHDGIGDTQMALATGLKVNPWSSLVISGAAVIRLNHQGLRADVIPTLGIEYTFF